MYIIMYRLVDQYCKETFTYITFKVPVVTFLDDLERFPTMSKNVSFTYEMYVDFQYFFNTTEMLL